jgi:hypothetical protein
MHCSHHVNVILVNPYNKCSHLMDEKMGAQEPR